MTSVFATGLPGTNSTNNSNTSNNNVPASLAKELNGNDFITLLVAQLKAQDPTSPMDPTQFVGQLVQFNSLQQLIGIKQDLDSAVSPPANSGSGSANAAAVQ